MAPRVAPASLALLCTALSGCGASPRAGGQEEAGAVGTAGGVNCWEDGRICLRVPPGALAEPVCFSAEQAGAAPGALGPVFRVRPTGSELAVAATVSVSYAGLDLGDVPPEVLAVAAWSAGGPQPLAGPVHLPDERMVSGTTLHLDRFALVAPRVSIAEVAVEEGADGSRVVRLPVRVAPPSPRAVEVAWATADDSAVAGEDYAAAEGVLRIPALRALQELDLTVFGDPDPEPHERFVVRLSDARGAALGDAEGGVRILDDDGGAGCDARELWRPCTVGEGACAAAGQTVCRDGEVACEAGAPGEPSPETCNGADDDCDGATDEAEAGGEGAPPLSEPCYSGPAGTDGVGACGGGTWTCAGGAWQGGCEGEVVPRPEACNGADDDCDGATDESDEDAEAALTETCYSGPAGTAGVGACARGLRTCVDGAWPEGCPGEVVPVAEVCNGADDDCDGPTDETPDGQPLSVACYGGPDGTEGVGACAGGRRVCTEGAWPGACAGEVVPAAEACNGADDDCDGATDESAEEPAAPLTEACYGGPDGTEGVGPCTGGRRTCLDGAWPPDCPGEVVPAPEDCNERDDDCDGATDEAGGGGALTRPCYTGPDGTEGVGSCAAGVQACAGGAWAAACAGEVGPGAEVCNGADDDCDGAVDDGDPGGGGDCGTGRPGLCASGVRHCRGGGVTCVPDRPPQDETCDGIDNDCDGHTDETEAGEPLSRACYTGGPGTRDVGLCRAGTRTCTNGRWPADCPGQVLPAADLCNGDDDDCDGQTDEADPGAGRPCSTGEDGVCAAGTQRCQGGRPVCERDTDPSVEVCNGRDDDCDGQTDQGDPGGGAVCATGEPGVCASGTQHCQIGRLICVSDVASSAEDCNGQDDDCDGQTDESGGGGALTAACYTGEAGTQGVGLCLSGTHACVGGQWPADCPGEVLPGPEVCDGEDDDCDGLADCDDPDCADDPACEAPACEDADLGSAEGAAVHEGSTVGAGDSDAGSCGGAGPGDVWLRWTPAAAGAYQIDLLGSSYDTVLYVRDGDCAGEELACNDDFAGRQSGVQVDLAASQRVVVVVDGYLEFEGDYVLNISALGACDPVDLGSALGAAVHEGTTVGAGNDDAGDCGGGGAPEVPLQWTAPAAGSYQIDAIGSAFDTVLYVRDGDCRGAELACNDDWAAPDERASGVTLELAGGQSVVIYVDGYADYEGAFVLNIQDVGGP